MKKASLLLVMCSLVFITGCALDSKDYVDLSDESVTIERSKKVKISGVFSYYEKDQLVISGSVSKRHNSYGVHGGHIDVELLDENEQIIASQDVKFSPISIPRRGNRRSRFHAKFPNEVASNLKVRLRYHREEHVES